MSVERISQYSKLPQEEEEEGEGEAEKRSGRARGEGEEEEETEEGTTLEIAGSTMEHTGRRRHMQSKRIYMICGVRCHE